MRSTPSPKSAWRVDAKWAAWVTTMCEDYLGATEAAKVLNVTRNSIYRWAREGLIKTYEHPSGTDIYSIRELEKYIDQGTIRATRINIIEESEND